ncbi:dicarboxylate/amino acid:cation symporter [Cyanobacterium aponinum FACHB-4101]|uniref:dicarboxylate/amino acid:cation symporter n=1 Tax=Cyanobacterium aponinum TaxID=379064 RepID=UPI001681642B|nr:dicarboxylate/amino acid:cation symporter [Cyanobacterium aponinum]MBD2394412.1 dicarboxylate/amino acid:cation symporter [Cyanobacterium aponinum FACHB-4101]
MTQNTSTNSSPLSSLIPILLGIFVGILLGGFLPIWGQEVKFLGKLFINALLMLVVPLVITSMIASITSLGDISKLKGIGLKTIIFYFITTGIAVVLGLVLVNITQPGVAQNDAERVLLRGGELLTNVEYKVEENEVLLLDTNLRKSFDDRYFVSLIDQDIRGNILEKTTINSQKIIVSQWENSQGEIVSPLRRGRGIKIDLTIAKRIEGKEKSSIKTTLEQVVTDLLPRNLFQSMVENDVLPLIIFSLVFGAILTTLEDGQIVIDFISVLNKAILKIVDLILIFAPIGIGALIAGRLGDAGGFEGFGSEFLSLWKYSSTVILGLILHGFFILTSILYLITSRSPFDYLRKTSPALITAFSTSSSSATIPITLECAIKNNKVDSKIADFVIPLGATINMDGTALYEAVAAVFIAQIYGIELSLGQLIVIFLTATLAAVGAAGIPEAGLVTMVIVLKAVNIPVEGISLILVIDWFLDRCRTTINVWGDSVGAAVINHLNQENVNSE